MRTTPHRVRQHSLHSIISVNRDRVYKATSFVELLHLTYAIYDQIDHHLLHGPLHHWSLSLFRKSSTLTISFLSFSISLSLSLSLPLSLSFSLSLSLSPSHTFSLSPSLSPSHCPTVPLTYARHTSRFLSMFCLTAPIALVGELGQ